MDSYSSILRRLDEAETRFVPPSLPAVLRLDELSSADFIPATKLTQRQATLLDAVKLGDSLRLRATLTTDATPDLISFALALAAVAPTATGFELRSAINSYIGKFVTRAMGVAPEGGDEGEGEASIAFLKEWARQADPYFAVKVREYHGFKTQGTGIEGDARLPSWLRKFRAMPSMVTAPPRVQEGGRGEIHGSMQFSFTTEGSLDFMLAREDARYPEGSPQRVGFAVLVSLVPPPRFVRGIKSVARGIGEIFRSMGRGVLKLGRAAVNLPRYSKIGVNIAQAARNFRDALGRLRKGPNESSAPLLPLFLSTLEREGLTLEDLWPDPSLVPFLPEKVDRHLFTLRQGYYLARTLDR